MGCLKLTYDYGPTLFVQEHGEKNPSADLQVWVNPERGFLGVGEVVQTQNGPGDGLDWGAGGRALVRLLVPFGNDIYPESEERGYDPNKIIITTDAMSGLPIGPSGGAKLVTNGIRLAKQLASEAQMTQAGKTIIESGKLTEAGRLARQYGGEAADWVKKSSTSYSLGSAKFETHWYENVVNWLRVEFKTKF